MQEENRKLNESIIKDDNLGNVTGGKIGGGCAEAICPKCSNYTSTYKTGRTKSRFFGLLTMYEWHCGNCGEDFWLYVSKKER